MRRAALTAGGTVPDRDELPVLLADGAQT